MRMILASKSPQRRSILASAGIDFSVVPSDCSEVVAAGVTPAEAVIILALRKANSVADKLDDALIIASDTLIDLDGIAIGKPSDEPQATATLRGLSGRTHIVRTAIAIVDTREGRAEVGVAETAVQFRVLPEHEIVSYVATGEPMGKAGAYAIQGKGRELIASIIGFEDTVIGFPLRTFTDLMKRFDLPNQMHP